MKKKPKQKFNYEDYDKLIDETVAHLEKTSKINLCLGALLLRIKTLYPHVFSECISQEEINKIFDIE